jgi:hypothetical protein
MATVSDAPDPERAASQQSAPSSLADQLSPQQEALARAFETFPVAPAAGPTLDKEGRRQAVYIQASARTHAQRGHTGSLSSLLCALRLSIQHTRVIIGDHAVLFTTMLHNFATRHRAQPAGTKLARGVVVRRMTLLSLLCGAERADVILNYFMRFQLLILADSIAMVTLVTLAWTQQLPRWVLWLLPQHMALVRDAARGPPPLARAPSLRGLGVVYLTHIRLCADVLHVHNGQHRHCQTSLLPVLLR